LLLYPESEEDGMKPLTGKELGILEACQIGKTTRNLRRTTTMQNNPAYPYMLEAAGQ
jgi:hypothetical protein